MLNEVKAAQADNPNDAEAHKNETLELQGASSKTWFCMQHPSVSAFGWAKVSARLFVLKPISYFDPLLTADGKLDSAPK
jgi:hypothetical protein